MSAVQNRIDKYKERARQIRYSLINSITLFSAKDSVELIPIIDRFFLFFQENLGIEIQESNTGRRVFSFSTAFSSLRDVLTPDFFASCICQELKLVIPDNKTKNYKIFLYNSDIHENPQLLQKDRIATLNTKLEILVNEINIENSDGLQNFLHEELIKAFESNNYPREYNQIASIGDFQITNDTIDSLYSRKCKESIRGILDDVFESFKGNPIIFSSGWGMTKLFAVIRYPSSLRTIEAYTEQILFSSRQKSIIEKNKTKINQGISTELLEKPLSDADKNSLASICFKLDTVQFGLGYDKTNQREEETLLYQSLNDADPNSVLFVPIHVNGCPWLALYRINIANEKINNWWLNFEMYSQYTLLIAEKLRLKTKEVVYTLIDIFIKDSINGNRVINASVNLNGFIDSFNEMMKHMSCYFPFPVIILRKQPKEATTYNFLHSFVDSDFELVLNKIWRQTVRYTQEEEEDYVNKIRAIFKINADFIKASDANRELLEASYGLSHLYGTRLKMAEKPRQEAMALVIRSFALTDEIKQKIQQSHSEFKNLEKLSELFTIIAKQYTERVEGPFFEVCNDKTYQENGNYNLKDSVKEIFGRYIKNISKSLIMPSRSFEILPYINNNSKRPFATLYDNILMEVIRNFEKNPTSDKLFVEIDEEKKLLCFRNEIEKDSKEDYSLEWAPLNPKKFWGALYYLHLLLRETQTGEIFYTYLPHEEERKMYYKCGIKFKGFNYG